MDATGRKLRASLAAHEMHGQGKTNTGPARAAFRARFYEQADPEGVLDPGEREKRAQHLITAYYKRLALMRRAKTRTPAR